MKEVYLFLLFLSFVYVLRYGFEFVIKLYLTDPEPMDLSETKVVLLYVAIAYIITYFFI